MKQLKINYEEKLKHLQIWHDAIMTKLYTSLKQEEEFVALMIKAEEYKAKGQKYHELNGHLD